MSYDFIKVLKENGGFWKYKPGQRYLAELTSGKVSNVFFDTGVVTTDPELLNRAAQSLVHRVDAPEDTTHVVGPACGGVTLAYEVARILGAKALFTEPKYDVQHGPDGWEPMKYGQKFRFELPKDSKILYVEDVITTGQSTLDMMSAVCPIPIEAELLCLVNRSGSNVLQHGRSEYPIKALAEVDVRTWDDLKDAQGDVPIIIGALKPKYKQEWKLLTEGE